MKSVNVYSSKTKSRRWYPFNDFILGMTKYDKGGDRSGSYYTGRNVDHRSNPREITLNTAAVKESGGVTQGLITWWEHVGDTVYGIDNKGNIYTRSSAGSHALVHTAPDSQGNGLAYYGADDYLYYINNKTFGRYGPISSSPQTFVDDYLGSQGGVPTNTNSVSLVSASSQYFKHADAAAFDITGDLAIEAVVNPTTLPTVGNSMTLVGKWDESTNHRSYKFDIFAISGYFGDGSDGTKTIASNTTDAPIDSACSGTAGTQTLSATNASFAVGQRILIHQTQGTNAGQNEINVITGYTAGTITLQTPLKGSYTTGAQVLVLKQYTNVTVNAGCIWTAKAWNGTTGGILGFLANGTFTNNGTVTATGKGFRGGTADFAYAFCGEGTAGASTKTYFANGNGGGGAGDSDMAGAGGGNGTPGDSPITTKGTHTAIGGSSVGTADLTSFDLGGGGGGGENPGGSAGQNGGGALFLAAVTITNNGSIVSNGVDAVYPGTEGAGGAGAGGSILLKAQTATLGSGLIVAQGGAAAANHFTPSGSSGKGGDGRVHIDYYVSYSGYALPSLNATQDNTLVTNTTYQLRLGISNNGTSFEYLTKNITLATGAWQGRLGVSWKASTATATFYQAGLNIGTTVGTKTSISNNASDFSIGANIGASAYQNFFNGLIDDVRVWGATRTDDQMISYNNIELGGGEANLNFYAKFNNSPNDATSFANNLTPINTPTYSTSVPFASPTTRQDIDQSYLQTAVGTYSVPTSLTESDKQTFVPAKNPFKSLDIDIAAKGTGNWTVVVHNGLNQQVASITVANALLPAAGFYEFIPSAVANTVLGATYHFHVYSSVNDGTINTHTAGDPTTIRFHTYYQFLLNTPYHPAMEVGSVLGIGNGRYFAVYDAAAGYNNQRLSFPSQWNVRCIGVWRNKFMIGCWKGSTISDFDQGIIFIWNGYDITYEDFIPVPEGGVMAMATVDDELYFIAGSKGTIVKYDGSTRLKKLRQIPFVTKATTIDVLPGAMTVWQKLIRIGYAQSSNNSTIQRGVYSLGENFDDESQSFTFDHVISTGRYDANVKIGALLPVNNTLLIGWQDGLAYGVDAINPSSGKVAPTGVIEGNITDFYIRYKEKMGLTIRADFKPLVSDEKVAVKYRFGYDQAWISADTTTLAPGDDHIRLPIPDDAGVGRHHEFQVGVSLTASTDGFVAPTVLEYSIEEDLLTSEEENDDNS